MNLPPCFSRPGFISLLSLALTGLNSVAATFQTNTIEGWRVMVNERLLTDDKAATDKALALLRMWGVPEPAGHESWYAQMTRPFRLVLK